MSAERVWLLSPDDFERFVDRVFTRNGAMRVGNVGGGQKFSDFEIQFPLTDETAVVQVKSQADQKELDRYVAELAGRPEDRLFFVYHSAPRALTTENPAVTIIGPTGFQNWPCGPVSATGSSNGRDGSDGPLGPCLCG